MFWPKSKRSNLCRGVVRRFMQGCGEERQAAGPQLRENLRMGAGVGIIRDAE